MNLKDILPPPEIEGAVARIFKTGLPNRYLDIDEPFIKIPMYYRVEKMIGETLYWAGITESQYWDADIKLS